jgi:hypothetical protein
MNEESWKELVAFPPPLLYVVTSTGTTNFGNEIGLLLRT